MGEEYWIDNKLWGKCTCTLRKSDGVLTITGGDTVETAKLGGNNSNAPWKKMDSGSRQYIYIYIKEIKVTTYVKFESDTSLDELFQNCINCITVNLSGLIITNEKMNGLFTNTPRLTTFTVPTQLDTNIKEYLGYRLYKWTDSSGKIINTADNIVSGKTYTEHGTIALKFGDCDCTLTKIDINNWTLEIGEGVGKVKISYDNKTFTSYSYPWYWKCSILTSVTITGKVSFEPNTSLNSMFNGCSSLTSLDVSKFDTSNVTDMNSMFSGCSGLTSLDVSKFNTSNVTDMSSMFFGCSKFASLDVSSWNTSKVKYMNAMFSGCSKLASLDVSSWNTSNVLWMNAMFNNCSGLTSLDVSKFDTSNVIYMEVMFFGCSSLKFIKLNNAITINNYIGLK